MSIIKYRAYKQGYLLLVYIDNVLRAKKYFNNMDELNLFIDINTLCNL